MLRLTWIRNVNTPELFAEISWLHQNPHKASLSSGCSLLNPPLMQPALSRSGPTHLWTASVRSRGGKKRSFSFFPSLPPSFLPSLLSIKCGVSGASRLRLSLSNEEKGALLRSLGCTNLRLFPTGIIFVFSCWKKYIADLVDSLIGCKQVGRSAQFWRSFDWHQRNILCRVCFIGSRCFYFFYFFLLFIFSNLAVCFGQAYTYDLFFFTF